MCNLYRFSLPTSLLKCNEYDFIRIGTVAGSEVQTINRLTGACSESIPGMMIITFHIDFLFPLLQSLLGKLNAQLA